ncbi:MAG TPA: AraC family transcriptional regulator, partial [Fibrobacteria bacterium]|nr:AraC family transcriptional regulator [Fibrobacteria bacterium]
APELADLGRIADELPEPGSFFRGVQPQRFEPPANVIVFHRNRASKLGNGHHYHYRFVLIVSLQASGTIVVGEKSLELCPGEALLVFPHQFHHFVFKESSPLNWVFVAFEQSGVEWMESLRDRVTVLSPAGLGYLKRLILAYREGAAAPGAGTSISLLTGLILLELAARKGRTGTHLGVVRPSPIDQIIRYIWDNFDKEIKVARLSALCPYSQSHLRLLFRKRMGMSLHTFIQKVKMNRARAMLLETPQNVSEVADACGYSSLYRFSRAFKRATGVSPRGYRKEKGAYL